jgi:hypothetical protein
MRIYFAMSKLILPAIIVVAVGALIGIFVVGNRSDSVSKTTAPLLGDKHANLGQKHIAAGAQHEAYNSNPPSSGSHYTSPAPWGIKDSELPDETLIHNLEHGGIEVAYKPDLPQAQIDQLKKIVAALPASGKFNETKAVLVPRAANERAIELGAWTYTLSLDAVEQGKIIDFYNGHLDKGPELVP